MHIPEIVAEDAYTHLSPLCVSHQDVISLTLQHAAHMALLESRFWLSLHSKLRKKM